MKLNFLIPFFFLSCVSAPDYLRGSGTLQPKPSVLQGHLSAFATALNGYNPEEEPSAKVEEAANDVLGDLFGSIRNQDLADVLVYLPAGGEYTQPVLVDRGHIARVLDGEGVMWMVVVADKHAAHAGEKATCPRIPLHLTSLGETRPSIAASAEGLVTAAITRNSTPPTSADPKDEVVETKDVSTYTDLCWGVQRFALQKDSYNRIVIEPPDFGPAKDSKVVKIQVMNDPLRIRLDGFCPNCDAGIRPASECGRDAGPVRDCASRLDGGAPQDGRPACDAGAQPEKVTAPVVFNFANSRIPTYGGSVALGADLYNFKLKRGCKADESCVPSVYAFLHIWDVQFPWPAHIYAQPKLRLSIPVVGVRLLDPVLGEVVVGARLGVEDGLSKPLSRFGLIIGAAYALRASGGNKTTITKTIDATGTQTSTDTSVSVSTKTETTTSSEVRDSDHTWRLFLGLDLAF